jgi:phytoene/squalene synthetase
MLAPEGRKAVYAAALIYKEILDEIEQYQYDIFSRRVVVSPFRKTMLLWKAVWNKNQS